LGKRPEHLTCDCFVRKIDEFKDEYFTSSIIFDDLIYNCYGELRCFLWDNVHTRSFEEKVIIEEKNLDQLNFLS